MSFASFLSRQRRALMLGLLIVLLHWMVLGWLNAQLGMARQAPREDTLVFARVLAPAAAPPPPPPRPAKATRTAPAPRPAPPAPAPARSLPPSLAQERAPVTVDALAEAPRAAAAVADTPAASDTLAAVTALPAVAAPPTVSAPPSYRIDAPPSTDMTMDVDRRDADGTHWSGEAVIAWKRSDGQYQARVEVGIRLLVARVNLLVLTSEGALTDAGFAPRTMTEKRRGRALTATHFNRDDGKITFSASAAAYPLQPGAQDKATVPLQLAAIARADPAQLDGNIDIQVGEDRDALVYRFQVAGREQLVTPLGRVDTLHLTRPPKPGSYNARLEVWLAPAWGWYPVQIRNTEASGAVTTQTARAIVATDTGS